MVARQEQARLCQGRGFSASFVGVSRWQVGLAVWLWTILWSAGPVFAQSERPVAVIDGEVIHDADLAPLVSGRMQQLRRQEYEIKAQALEEFINQKLLESEAARQNVTPAELLAREADATVTPPTSGEMEAVYTAQEDRINRPFEEVKPQIEQMLLQSRIEQARTAYLNALRDRADVAVHLQPPRVEVSHDPARVRGNPDAPVMIVEFSDFQCPFCQRAYPVVKQLLAKYPNQVKLAYRDYPLRQIHPQADAAASASRCAGEQGKFWQFHDRLFESDLPLDRPSFVEHAAQLGLDAAQFGECLSANQFAALIEQDLQDGNRAGVNGTPAFFINGVALTGAQPLAAFDKVVEEELDLLRRSEAAPQAAP